MTFERIRLTSNATRAKLTKLDGGKPTNADRSVTNGNNMNNKLTFKQGYRLLNGGESHPNFLQAKPK